MLVVNVSRFDWRAAINDLSGRRGIYQAGIKASFSSTLSGHLGVGYSRGAGVESPWNAVVGVNWSF